MGELPLEPQFCAWFSPHFLFIETINDMPIYYTNLHKLGPFYFECKTYEYVLTFLQHWEFRWIKHASTFVDKSNELKRNSPPPKCKTPKN